MQIAVLPILARLLGPAAFGLVALAMPLILLANMVSDAGLGNALVRVRHLVERTRIDDLLVFAQPSLGLG